MIRAAATIAAHWACATTATAALTVSRAHVAGFAQVGVAAAVAALKLALAAIGDAVDAAFASRALLLVVMMMMSSVVGEWQRLVCGERNSATERGEGNAPDGHRTQLQVVAVADSLASAR